MKKIISFLVMTIFLSSCAVEKKKLTENVGKYIPPNVDDTNFKNSKETLLYRIKNCILCKVS